MKNYVMGITILTFASIQFVCGVHVMKLERKVAELKSAVYWVQKGVSDEEDWSLAFVGYVDDWIR